MRRPPSIFITIVAVVAGFLLLGAIFGGGGDWRHENDNRITIVNPDNGAGTGSSRVTVDGQQVAPGSVVVIDNGRRGFGFFPFFPIFPLLLFGFLIFLFTRARRFRGYCGDGRGPGFGPGRWENHSDSPRPEHPSRYTDSPEHAWFNREMQAPASSAPQASTTAPAPQSATDASATDAPTSEAGPAAQS